MEPNRVASLRKIVVTGPVGVGKSTFIANLELIFRIYGVKYTLVPEYIEGDVEGPAMLSKYFNKEITPYEFQSYVLNYYNSYLTWLSEEIESDTILIFERSVDDSVLCFGNLLYNKGEINLLEYYYLYRDAVAIDKKFNVPSLFDRQPNDYSFIMLKTFLDMDYGPLVHHMIQASQENFLFGLYNDDDVCYHRVRERNRDGEEAYSYQSIKEFDQRYIDIYNWVMRGLNIPFTSIDLTLKV